MDNAVNPLVEMIGISKSYGCVRACRDIDLTVRRGEALLIAGGNGSGKSTLAWIMAGLIEPSRGSCELRDAAGSHPVSTRIGSVALAFQHSRLQLQRQTVAAEIEDWGGSGTGSAAVGRALDAVGLDRA